MKKEIVKKVSKSAQVASVSSSFWSNISKPFFVIAPMANVTDAVFRKMFAKYGKPDVTWTEFVSADGLNSDGQKRLLIDLVYSENERPVVAQLFTGHPGEINKAAKLVAELGFDGLDINMGCPDRAVQKQGGGAALIKNPKLALEILESARKGVMNEGARVMGRARNVGKQSRHIPVSVKTRIGFNAIDLGWIELLLKQKLPALTIHLRTRKEMSDEPAHWDLMPAIIKMRDEISPLTLVIGNGDVRSMKQAREYTEKYGCDGVMIGRGAFGKPWFFAGGEGTGSRTHGAEKTPEERLKILVEHTKLFEKTYCGEKHQKSFDMMKKHFKAYVSGWNGAKELRTELMSAKDSKGVAKIIAKYSISSSI